jgi:hypothetical protein
MAELRVRVSMDSRTQVFTYNYFSEGGASHFLATRKNASMR